MRTAFYSAYCGGVQLVTAGGTEPSGLQQPDRRAAGVDGDSSLSEQTGGQSLEISSTMDLQKAFVGILDEFRRRYVLSFTPRGVSGTGWHRLQVRVKGRRAVITARQGYTAGG